MSLMTKQQTLEEFIGESLYEEVQIIIGEDRSTGKFHGLLYKNHKPPSGCDIWLLSISSSVGYETAADAEVSFREQLLDSFTTPRPDLIQPQSNHHQNIT